MRILVPLDGSLLAERAIAPAAMLARRTVAPSSITLVCVDTHDAVQAAVAEEFSPAVAAGIPDRIVDYLAYLEDLRLSKALLDLNINLAVIPGEPGAALSAFAREQRADLVVMASHVLTGLDAALWGSVTEQVARDSGIPTLIIRPEGPAFPDAEQAEPFTILVPLDGTPFAETAIASGVQLAKLLQGEILLLHVIPDDVRDPAQHRDEEASYVYLDGVATRLERSGVAVDRLIVRGNPSDAISAVLQDQRADLIVIATHGQGGAHASLRSSIAESVLHHVRAPVVVIHPLFPDTPTSAMDKTATR